MIKTIQTLQGSLVSLGILSALFFLSFATAQTAHAAIDGQLRLGSTGSEVTELQRFLATNSYIYPQAIVSGFFGPLTQAAVVQFQVAYDIPQVGQVGPMTRNKINDIMSSGYGLDTTAPTMSNLSLQTGREYATVAWTSDELASSQVFYDTTPLRANEATRHAEQAYVSGVLTSSGANVRNAQSLTMTGLQPNTLYYYLTRTIDNSGNITMTWPNTFRTN